VNQHDPARIAAELLVAQRPAISAWVEGETDHCILLVDSFKTELVAERTWRSVAQAELAIVEWVSWFNHDRLHSSIGDIPPVEFEQNYWERVKTGPPPGCACPPGSLRRAAIEQPEPLPSSVKLQANEAT
jgi:hypothetical protein